MLTIKRAYEPLSKKDGYRILVDRLWPRGLKKENLALDAWFKDLAPSTDLRKEFAHDPKLWKFFQSKYKKELKSSEAREKIKVIAKMAKTRNVTLIYGARDQEHNDAVVLKSVLEKELLKK